MDIAPITAAAWRLFQIPEAWTAVSFYSRFRGSGIRDAPVWAVLTAVTRMGAMRSQMGFGHVQGSTGLGHPR